MSPKGKMKPNQPEAQQPDEAQHTPLRSPS